MNKKLYLAQKIVNRELGKSIRSIKDLVRSGWSERGMKRDERESLCYELYNKRREFRIMHVFLSLLRGKTIDQIEPNAREDYDFCCVHTQVEKLCEKYDLICDMDVNPKRVLSIERPWIKK